MVLPDLARFSEGKSKLLLPEAKKSAHPSFPALEEGCIIHYHADKKFHASEVFQQMTQEIENIFYAHEFETGNIRRWFLTHLLSEMLFDRVLIKKSPEILESFYKDLQQVSPAVVASYLSACGRAGTERFTLSFKRFAESQFLFSYREDDGFLISLNRTMQKAAQPPAEGAIAEMLLEMFPEMEARLMTYEAELEKIMSQ